MIQSLKRKIADLMEIELARYIFVGGSVYVLEIAIIAAGELAEFNSLLTVTASFWVGLVVSFALQKIVTFRDNRMHHKVLLPQLIAVSLLVVFNYLFTLGVAKLLGSVFPLFVTRTIAITITTLWNFVLFRTKIFKSDVSLID